MSKIKVDNIRIASESVSRPVRGVAAAWCIFDGYTATAASDMTGIKGSMNISGLIDKKVGDYDLKVTSYLSSSIASASAGQFDDGGGVTPTAVLDVSTILVQFYSGVTSHADAEHLSSTVHGDLA